MKKTVKRDVVVEFCDFCGDETTHTVTCAICKRAMCYKDSLKAHAAYSSEGMYRYDDGGRIGPHHICKRCAAMKLSDLRIATIQELYDSMMSKDPVPTVVKKLEKAY